MQILKINSGRPQKSVVQKAVEVLKQGGVIVYPTETAYGLGCDATNLQAVKKIYGIKGREKGKPLPLIVADYKMASRYVRITPAAKNLIKKYWPGPLTVVFETRNFPPKADQPRAEKLEIQKLQGTEAHTAAVRVSSHPVAQALARSLSRPIVATSANKSGSSVCYSILCVKKSLQQSFFEADIVLDAGRLSKRPTSTIVDVVGKALKILRQGKIKIDRFHAAAWN